MEYVKIEGQFPKFSHCAVTLGKFDGIHRGHRNLIQTILNRKKEYGELAVVMAFVSDRQTILTSEERRILLEKCRIGRRINIAYFYMTGQILISL